MLRGNSVKGRQLTTGATEMVALGIQGSSLQGKGQSQGSDQGHSSFTSSHMETYFPKLRPPVGSSDVIRKAEIPLYGLICSFASETNSISNP